MKVEMKISRIAKIVVKIILDSKISAILRHQHERQPELQNDLEKMRQSLIQPYCMGCHGDFKNRKNQVW